jgi:DNA-binding transcriptional LysR family regulator
MAKRGSSEVLELLDGSERDLAERLDRGRIDLALTVIRPHHAASVPSFWRANAISWCCRRDHPLADAERIEPEALAGDRMVVRRHCEALARDQSASSPARGVRPALRAQDHQRPARARRGSRGQGIGMMPESFADPLVRMVRVADFDLVPGDRHASMLRAAKRARVAESPFLALLRDHYRGDEGCLPATTN